MSLGRVYPGRLPSTQADIDLINHRIQIVNQQMKQLDQMVATGNIDNREAAYRRQYLSGEVLELKDAIARMRLSTPSYKVPSDLQAHVAKKPQNKMWSPETTRDELPQGYFGTDNGQKINSIPSDWTPTELTDFDVPDVKGQPGWHRGNWPAHWPGSHSPSINRAVMQAGEINGRQVIDPRDPNMQLRLNLVQNPQHMAMALQVKARYEQLYEITVANPIFTPTDQTLVNIIIGKINRQITFAEQEIERLKLLKPDPTKQFEESKQTALDQSNAGTDQKAGDVNINLPINTLPRGPSFGPAVGPKLPSTMGRRTGRLMGLGAMQAADRNRALTTPRGQVTPSQQASYNATLREMTMARARAGASLDVNQQIREQAVTRPWSIQVTLPGETVQMLHNMMDISLAQAGLTQDMFTQQAHDYVASIINSLDSSMTPTQQTEYVVERIMSEMVNRSALLKRDVNVDINMEQQQVTFNEVNGLSGGFLKTKAALGRLLG